MRLHLNPGNHALFSTLTPTSLEQRKIHSTATLTLFEKVELIPNRNRLRSPSGGADYLDNIPIERMHRILFTCREIPFATIRTKLAVELFDQPSDFVK